MLAGSGLLVAAWHRAGLDLAAVPKGVRAAAVRWASTAPVVIVAFALRCWGPTRTLPGGRWAVWRYRFRSPAALAVWSLRVSLLAIAGVLLNLAVTVWWFESRFWRRCGWGSGQ